VTIVLVATVSLEHGVFGGNRADIALGFTIVYGLILLGAVSTAWGAARLAAAPGLGVSAALFALVLAALALSLAPLDLDGRIGPPIGRAGASIAPLATVIEGAKLLGYACAFTTAALLTQDRRGSALFLRAMLISAIALALFCLIAEALSARSVGGWVKPIIARGRVSGLFSSPNTAATVFAVYALLASGALVRMAGELRRRRLRSQIREIISGRHVEIVAFALSFQCLLLSSSRGAIGAFALAFCALAAGLGWRSRRRALAFGILAALVVLVAAVNGELAVHRYATGAYAGDDRVLWMRTALGAFLGAPLQGYGLGSLAMVFHSAATPQTFRALDWAGSAHNVYLQWLTEGGLLGAAPMFALIGWILWRAIAPAARDGQGAVTRPTLIACLGLVIVHSLLEYSLQEPSIAALFSILLGAATGLSCRAPSADAVRGATP
jgi:O-antigen ligase